MARYSVKFSALNDAIKTLGTTGSELEDCADVLATVSHDLAQSKTLQDLTYVDLVKKLSARVAELGTDVIDAEERLESVSDRVVRAETEAQRLISDATASRGVSTRNVATSSRANQATGDGTVKAQQSDRATRYSEAAAGGAGTTSSVAGAASGAVVGGVGEATASMGADAAAASDVGGGAAYDAGGAFGSDNVGSGGFGSGSGLAADGFGAMAGSGSDNPLQQIMDQILGKDSATSPVTSLSSSMQGQMQGFASRWSSFEQLARASQNASGSFGGEVMSRISTGFAGLIDMGGRGLAMFGSAVTTAVTRYGGGVAAVTSTVTFIATSINGAFSFTPSAVSHAFNLGTTKLAGGISPVSFAQLLRR